MIYTDFSRVPTKQYQVLYVDPPWDYYGDPNKMAAAGKHYALMKDEDLFAMSVREKVAKRSVCFMWATSPRLDAAIDLLRHWGFFYRGVAFVWVKTRQDGGIIGAQGVRPSIVKPTTEYVLAGSTVPKGRPLPLDSEAVSQVLLAPRGAHSEKPLEIRSRIESLYGQTVPKLEMFARGGPVVGWDRFGNQVQGMCTVRRK